MAFITLCLVESHPNINCLVSKAPKRYKCNAMIGNFYLLTKLSMSKSKFLQADHPLYFANESIIKNFQFIMDAENSIVIPQSLFDKLNPSLNNPFRGTKI